MINTSSELLSTMTNHPKKYHYNLLILSKTISIQICSEKQKEILGIKFVEVQSLQIATPLY